MALVALAAFAISGLQAAQHWEECRKREWSLRELRLSMQEYALTARETAEEIAGAPDDFEAGSTEGNLIRSEWQGVISTTRSTTIPQLLATLGRRADEFDAIGAVCGEFERRYHEAALRPWVDVKAIDRDVEQMKLRYRKAHDTADPAAE